MMLSTNPRAPACPNKTGTDTVLRTGLLIPKSDDSKSALLQNRPFLTRAVIQLEEDSTDIGSALSSDVDMPCSSGPTSPSHSDEEVIQDGQGKNDSRCLLTPKRQHNKTALLKSNRRTGSFRGTPLEPIMGTPAGMSEHPPLFFAPESSDDTKSQSSAHKPEGFCAPPGLSSPQRSRKPKGQSLLATAPKLPSPRRSRKAKVHSTQSVLATAPEHLLCSAHISPPSPTRRVRSTILDNARRDAAPLKVEMTSEMFAKGVQKALDPSQPVKKRPILADSHEGLPKLKPGVPAKKRVTPWLLEEPIRTLPAMPR